MRLLLGAAPLSLVWPVGGWASLHQRPLGIRRVFSVPYFRVYVAYHLHKRLACFTAWNRRIYVVSYAFNEALCFSLSTPPLFVASVVDAGHTRSSSRERNRILYGETDTH